MSRVLLMQRSIVPKRDRAGYMQRLREKRDYYAKANCRFWAFEEALLQGAFLEFIESADADTLIRAHEGAPDRVLDAMRIYQEVELS